MSKKKKKKKRVPDAASRARVIASREKRTKARLAAIAERTLANEAILSSDGAWIVVEADGRPIAGLTAPSPDGSIRVIHRDGAREVRPLPADFEALLWLYDAAYTALYYPEHETETVFCTESEDDDDSPEGIPVVLIAARCEAAEQWLNAMRHELVTQLRSNSFVLKDLYLFHEFVADEQMRKEIEERWPWYESSRYLNDLGEPDEAFLRGLRDVIRMLPEL